jgi:predicted  nucleic acid-binding Zn-ribbon protein
LLDEGLLTGPDIVAAAQALSDAPRETLAEIVSKLEGTQPQAARLLSAVAGETVDDARSVIDELTGRLREFDLRERIAAGQARLRNPEGFKDEKAYDDLFRDVSALMRELEELRRNLGDN